MWAILLVGILLCSVFSAGAFAEIERNPNVKSIKIEYNTKIASNTHYLQFKTCLGNKHAQTPTFQIESDMETKLVKFQKLQQAHTCKSYEVKTTAKHFSSVKVSMSDISNFI